MLMPKQDLYIDHSILEKWNQQFQQLKNELDETKNELSQLRKRTEDLSEHAISDGLTGVYTRKVFDLKMIENINLFHRYEIPFALIILDIDNFNKINEDLGYSKGDQILIQLSKRIRSSIRKTDYLARYSGEQFAILLFKSNFDTAYKVAKKIHDCITEDKFLNREENPVSLSVSIGVSTLKSFDDHDSFISRTLKALEKAKLNGKNQIQTEKDLLSQS